MLRREDGEGDEQSLSDRKGKKEKSGKQEKDKSLRKKQQREGGALYELCF